MCWSSSVRYVQCKMYFCTSTYTTLIKKKIKLSSYIRKFRVEQLQSHIWLTASSYIGKYLRISSYIRKPFLIYDFATAPLWISLYMRKILFSLYQILFSFFYQCRVRMALKCTVLRTHKTFMLLSWWCPFRAWKELADKTVYQNGSTDTSFHPPLISLDSTFKSSENLFIKIA